MAAYVLDTLLFLNLIASGVYLLSKGVLFWAKDRVDERFRYWICLAVMLLFLLPFYQLLPRPAAQSDRDFTVRDDIRAAGDLAFEEPYSPEEDLAVKDTPPDSPAVRLPTPPNGRLALWAAGAAVLLLWHGVTFVHFRRRVSFRHGRPVSAELQQVAIACAKECGLRQTPILRVLPNVHGPMMIGFLKPIIAMPIEELPPDDAALILQHELIHFKRRDLWWKLLGILVRSIHWFNPLVWMLGRDLEFYTETSCDAEVVRNLDHAARKQYGHLLLSYVRLQHLCKPMPGLSFPPARNKVKRRISLMLNGTKSKKLILAAIVCIFAVSSVTLSAYAADHQRRNPRKTDDLLIQQTDTVRDAAAYDGNRQETPENTDDSNDWTGRSDTADRRYCQESDTCSVRHRRNCDGRGYGCSPVQAGQGRCSRGSASCRNTVS